MNNVIVALAQLAVGVLTAFTAFFAKQAGRDEVNATRAESANKSYEKERVAEKAADEKTFDDMLSFNDWMRERDGH